MLIDGRIGGRIFRLFQHSPVSNGHPTMPPKRIPSSIGTTSNNCLIQLSNHGRDLAVSATDCGQSSSLKEMIDSASKNYSFSNHKTFQLGLQCKTTQVGLLYNNIISIRCLYLLIN